MQLPQPRVYTIAPGGDFLKILAREILLGFPFGESERQHPLLSRWTILLPTRRAARTLGSLLLENCGHQALLLPSIKPIGDIDDEALTDDGSAPDISRAISRTGQLLLMLDILKQWAAENPQTHVAGEIQNSHIQSLGLATSLLRLVDQMETEETNLNHLTEAYNADLSDHRQALLGLLSLLKVELPRRLMEENLMGSAARRSLLIRLEAQRISRSKLGGPIIAAGSTGTIPATRALLKAIAHHPQGTLILPGLDCELAEDDWNSITIDHPQHGLKTLIDDISITQKEVIALSPGHRPRNLLSQEVMRPSSSADQWYHIMKGRGEETKAALANLHFVNAPDRHIEARAIALIMREALETPRQITALITPDRDLAQRVKAELARWHITVDDSAGEPLVHHGLAALAVQLLQAATNGFKSADILGLLSHPDCTLGYEREEFLRNLRNLEIVLFRGYGSAESLVGLQRAMLRALEGKRIKARVHSLVSALSESDWLNLQKFVDIICTTLRPFDQQNLESGEKQIQDFETCIDQLAPAANWQTEENQMFAEVLRELHVESKRLPTSYFSAVSVIILHVLREQTQRIARPTHPRLVIYGVLEARLMPADIVILGGLNEGLWPALPDSGPWFNRPMRSLFGMQQPERSIGVSAHDFTQAFGYQKIYLTWSQRLGGAPHLASRWILRLQTVIQAAGLSASAVQDHSWVKLAQELDAASERVPATKPKPRPTKDVRPTNFSVSDVEKLIRDPYAIYARKILKLEPLPPLSRNADAALRGTIFHDAIRDWNLQQPDELSSRSLQILLEAGEKSFLQLRDDPEIKSFWWPRFKRMAVWLAEHEVELRRNHFQAFAEITGGIEFALNGVTHRLSARADRIDALADGTARILDYKSGGLPSAKQVRSGISPQLVLEAAIVSAGGFATFPRRPVSQLAYLRISGGFPAGEYIEITADKDGSVAELAERQLSGLKSLLQNYQDSAQAYFPRAAIQLEEEETDYDHLSRYREWLLAGER